MCDKKNSVLFNDTECIVLSPNFKLIDESQVLLRVPRKNNMYSVDLKNIVPKGGLTCLFAKATSDESKLWHRRLGHLNFKTMNKLVKGNLVRGLPSKLFENDQTCVACQKGKQHRASCKFDGKADEGFFVGYSLNSKAFRVFNSRTRIVEENLHIRFSESTPNVVGSGPDWLFDIDALTRTMNYEPIVADPKSSHDDGSKPSSDDGKKVDEDPRKDSECKDQEKEDNVNNTNNVNTAGNVNTVSSTVNAAGINEVNAVGRKTSIELPFDPNMPALKDYNIFGFSRDDEDDGAVADMNNLDTTIQIYEPELIGSTNTSQNSQNVAFVSSNSTNNHSNSSTNEADNTTYGFSDAHTQSNSTSGDNLCDAVIYAFLASQPNSPQLAREDLEQIDPDDIKEMDLQWEMAMLTIRARRFIKRTGRKLDVNGQRVRFDRGRENSKRTVTVETPTENAQVAQDGIGGYNWSYQAEEKHPKKLCIDGTYIFRKFFQFRF
ncbi:putative ribonuclease H-like domain-containing protein [Tanacetum coccineum]